MVWCNQCAMEVEVEADDSNGFSCCVQCGRVVEDTAFSSDVMFSKGADGEGELVGQMVGASGEARGVPRFAGGRLWASGGDGHEAAVSRGRYEISALVEALRISPASEATDAAHRLYRLALQWGFTKGRRVNQVAAVCLYIFCRLEKRPYMLIDFSDHLSVNVYSLGGVFLQMLRLLRLDDHATFTKPIDPSLFMNRFVDRLRLPTPELKSKVSNTAMRLVQSMKRDWMLVGRRPSGICGAALFLAAHIHGVEKTKKDVIAIVHIGWSTVEKRVLELAETKDADLTLRELAERDQAAEVQREQLLLEYERTATAERQQAAAALTAAAASGEGGEEGAAAAAAAVVPSDPNAAGRYCEHVRAGSPVLAHGMCRQCLEEYLEVTMAVQTGAYDPPAYLRNLRRDIRKRVREKLAGEASVLAVKGSGTVLALEGPGGPAEDLEEMHHRRHLENEAALEQAEQGGSGPPGSDAAGAGPSGSAAGAAAAAATLPASLPPAATGAIVVLGGDEEEVREEEEDFNEALQSNEIKPLAKVLGGVVPEVASALQCPQRPPRPAAVVVAAVAGDSGGGPSGSAADATGVPGGSGRGLGRIAGIDVGEEDENEGGGKRARRGAAEEATARAIADAVAEAAAEAVVGPVGESAVTAADSGGGGDDGSGSSDNLSDVDDEEIAGYLATREEATVREQLWVEMNKDWIEKQQAKKAAEADEANKPQDKNKRKYTRKPKPEVAAADDAAGSTRNLLESKKLSNKINYGALEDLFGGNDAQAAATAAAGPSGSGRRSASVEPDFGRTARGPGFGPASMEDERPAVAEALAKRATAKAQAQAADADRYSSALADETRRRGGMGGGGGFLDSLTFAKGHGDAGGRLRPQGLSLKPRGR